MKDIIDLELNDVEFLRTKEVLIPFNDLDITQSDIVQMQQKLSKLYPDTKNIRKTFILKILINNLNY